MKDSEFEFSSPPPQETRESEFEFSSPPPPQETKENEFEFSSPPLQEVKDNDFEFSSPPPQETKESEFSSPPPQETKDSGFEFSSPPPPQEVKENEFEFSSPQENMNESVDTPNKFFSGIVVIHGDNESCYEESKINNPIEINEQHELENELDYSEDKYSESEECVLSCVEARGLNLPEISNREKLKEVIQERLINGLLRADMKAECFSSKKSGFDFVDFFFVLSVKVVKSIKEKYSSFDKSNSEEQGWIFSEMESILPGSRVSSVTLFGYGDPECTRLTGRYSCFFGHKTHSLLIKMSDDNSGNESREDSIDANDRTFVNPTLKYVLADGLGPTKAAEVMEYLFNEFDDFRCLVPIWHNRYHQERRLAICYIDGRGEPRPLSTLLNGRFSGIFFREVEEAYLVNVFACDGLSGFSSAAGGFGVIHKEECANSCPRTYDKRHMSACVHRHSATPCPNIMNCIDESQRHREEYVHFCKLGSFCTKQNESEHVKSYIHLKPVERCEKCVNLDSGMTGNHYAVCHGCMLPVCNMSHTYDDDDDDDDDDDKEAHKSQFIHPLMDVPFTSYSKSTDPLNIKWAHYGTDLQNKIKEYFGLDNSDMKSRNVEDVRMWLESLSPVHKCDLDTLRLIVASGFVLSLNKLKELPSDPELISECVWAQRSGRELLSKYHNHYDEPKYVAAKRVALSFARKAVNTTYQPNSLEEYAFAYLPKDDVDRIQECVTRTYGSILESSRRCRGMKSKCDLKTSTSDSIFASLGPNQSDYGGSKVSIVFHPLVMRHPDFYMSIVGSLCYAKRSSLESKNICVLAYFFRLTSVITFLK